MVVILLLLLLMIMVLTTRSMSWKNTVLGAHGLEQHSLIKPSSTPLQQPPPKPERTTLSHVPNRQQQSTTQSTPNRWRTIVMHWLQQALAPYHPINNKNNIHRRSRKPQAQENGAWRKTMSHTKNESTHGTSSKPNKFPMLQVQLLQHSSGQYGSHTVQQQHQQTAEPFVLNDETPYEFETDLFRGKLLVLLRPAHPDDDPYWSPRLWASSSPQPITNKKQIIIQVQGQFKQAPTTGRVYMGGERLRPLQLGPWMYRLTTLLLRLIQGFCPQLHYSYGGGGRHPRSSTSRSRTHRNQDDNNEHLNDDTTSTRLDDLPRIVVPAHLGWTRIHVTPAGSEPPPMTAHAFEEPDRLQRLSQSTWEWNTRDIYSLTFSTMFFHLAHWKLDHLPVGSGTHLSTFWGSSPLRIAMYEHVPPSSFDDNHHPKEEDANLKNGDSTKSQQEEDAIHWQQHNRYHFGIQLTYLGNGERQP